MIKSNIKWPLLIILISLNITNSVKAENEDSTAPIKYKKDILVHYLVTGGKYNNIITLTILKNGEIYYSIRSKNVGKSLVAVKVKRELTDTLDKDAIQKIINVFDENKFFSLKNKYATNPVTDNIVHTITYNNNSITKTVTITDTSRQFFNIVYMLDTIIKELKKRKNPTGEIEPKPEMEVEVFVMLPRKRIEGSLPPYPDWAKQQGLEATLSFQLEVDSEGKIITGSQNIISSTGFPDWDNGAINWIKDNWKWEKISSGKTSGVMTIKFRIIQ
ncbi:MAG: energy transducer TonB [bacterium]